MLKPVNLSLRTLIFILLCLVMASCGREQPISISVNGQVIDNSGIVMRDKKLFVSDTFVRDTLQFRLQWLEGVPDPTRFHYIDKVAILMYHDLTDIANDPDSPKAMQVADFEEQMRLLKENGFHAITMAQYSAFMLDNAPVPDNAVLITFDDGYESFYTLAYPILLKYEYSAANFVIVSSIDRRSGRPKLSWDQMREMQKHNISFHSHTYDSHRYGPVNAKLQEGPVLSNRLYLEQVKRVESELEYQRRISADIQLAEQRLKEELGRGSLVLAFPYGAQNELVHKTLRESGIPLSFTTKPGIQKVGEEHGFRFNAPGLGDKLIERLQTYQITARDQTTSTKAGIGNTLVVDDAILTLPNTLPPRKGRPGLIPLRAFCDFYNIQLVWQADSSRVELKR